MVNVITNGTITHPGKISYETKCVDCHGNKGEGIKTLVPPLLKSDFAAKNFDSIPCWILNGISHPITVNGIVYDQPMYGIKMNEIEMSNVLNYISSEMLEIDREITSQQVRELLKNCK